MNKYEIAMLVIATLTLIVTALNSSSKIELAKKIACPSVEASGQAYKANRGEPQYCGFPLYFLNIA